MRAFSYVGAVFFLLLVVVLVPSQNVKVSVERNSDWTPLVHTFHGMKMVIVPAGCFYLRYSSTEHTCIEHLYFIGQHQVTIAEFNRFTRKAGSGYRAHGTDSNDPINDVTWYEARDFCAEYGMRLPSNIELEYAATGTDQSIRADGKWVGLFEMLTDPEWTDSQNASDTDHSGDLGDHPHLRGGAAGASPNELYSSLNRFGFRCAVDPAQQYEWQPRLYAGFTPTPTPHPTDICCD